MKYYCVVGRFYDNGKVKSFMEEKEGETIPKDEYRETNVYDEYRDYFKSRSQAQQWLNDYIYA